MALVPRHLFTSAPILSREWLINHSWVVVGSVLLAAGYNLFIIPHDVVPGGIIGLSMLINHLTGWPIGLMAMVINIPILVVASRIMGPGYGVKTALAMTVSSLTIDLMGSWRGIDPVVPDILISTVFGGVVIGVGVATIIKGKANAGGTSLVGQLISRITRIPTGQCMLYVDAVIVLASVVIFRNLEAAPYAIIGIFTISRSLDAVLHGLEASKAMMIISKHHEEVRQIILEGLHRGGTVLSGHGLFMDEEERQIVFTALSRREAVVLQKKIRTIDPEAFCIVFDTSDVLGSGFKPWN